MNTHTDVMPVDKTIIKTILGIHPEVINNLKAYVEAHDLSARTIKPTKWEMPNGETTRKLTLYVHAYGGIKVVLEIPDGISAARGTVFANATIEFNPGKCLYGHNGRILSLTEFIHALCALASCLTPLLHDSKDWVNLVPGLRVGSPAYWHYVEVPFQCRDANGELLSRLRHAYHPLSRRARHWPTSLEMGSRNSGRQLSIYMKAVEMESRSKFDMSKHTDAFDILRLELRMRASKESKSNKLIKYLGSDSNNELIDGNKQLVRFFSCDLVRALRTVFGELQGIYLSDQSEEGENRAHGRMLAEVAQRAQHPFPALLNTIKYYTWASLHTISTIRKAGLHKLSENSTVTREDLFSDYAFAARIGIAIAERENLICLPSYDTDIHRLVSKAYSPPSQLFRPHIELPSYMR